jgi:PIN domain nuclease of toxin-antitoxin system
MRLILDTHILIWAAAGTLSKKAAAYIGDENNELYFSTISIWEMAIKRKLGKSDFQYDPELIYKGLLRNGYIEVPITAKQVIATQELPDIHKDPFDRMIAAQAIDENLILLTADKTVGKYVKTAIVV